MKVKKKEVLNQVLLNKNNRLNYDLAISRTFDDNEYKKFVLIANPYISKKM